MRHANFFNFFRVVLLVWAIWALASSRWYFGTSLIVLLLCTYGTERLKRRRLGAIGLLCLLVGILFVVLLARHWLSELMR